jgi:trafficking protein particle complex subunit 12
MLKSTSEKHAPATEPAESKDLSFLLEPSIYHPLSQLDVPGPFRRPFPVDQSTTIKLADNMKLLDTLLADCNFIGAAFVAGSLLASGTLTPTDSGTIFRLLAVRYSCLELSGNVMLAAQEAKALEDLGSAFYYDDLTEVEPNQEDDNVRPLPRHIMPFNLRLQALRLQSIGFSDPRRGVAALYDLGLECRDKIASIQNSESDRQVWSLRLQEVGARVINALIEMGDLDCARRTLESMKPASPHASRTTEWTYRMALVCLKLGLTERVEDLVEGLESQQPILASLLAIAEDDLDRAEALLQDLTDADTEISGLAKQNLAVALLFKGEIERARTILESLVDQQESFQTLTVNLATLFDLMSDQSRNMKSALVGRLASQSGTLKQPRAFTNSDFKL